MNVFEDFFSKHVNEVFNAEERPLVSEDSDLSRSDSLSDNMEQVPHEDVSQQKAIILQDIKISGSKITVLKQFNQDEEAAWDYILPETDTEDDIIESSQENVNRLVVF